MNDYLETKELYHHGIKGVRWGIRREDKQIRERTKEHKKLGTATGAVIGGLLGTAAGIGSTYLLGKGHIFSKNSKGKLVDKMTGQKYSSVVRQSRKRTIGLTFLGAYMGAKIGRYSASKKASEENLKDIRYQNLSDRQKSQLIKNNVLEHSGIKGQKWGIRRYQNEDGSLTEEGKKRYGNPETYRAVAKEVSSLEEATKGASSAVSTAASIINTQRGGKAIRKDYSNLSDKELQEKINRLNLERAYGDLSGDTKYVKTGKEKAREILQTAGATLAIASTAIAIYAQLHGFKDIGGKKKKG